MTAPDLPVMTPEQIVDQALRGPRRAAPSRILSTVIVKALRKHGHITPEEAGA